MCAFYLPKRVYSLPIELGVWHPEILIKHIFIDNCCILRLVLCFLPPPPPFCHFTFFSTFTRVTKHFHILCTFYLKIPKYYLKWNYLYLYLFLLQWLILETLNAYTVYFLIVELKQTWYISRNAHGMGLAFPVAMTEVKWPQCALCVSCRTEN